MNQNIAELNQTIRELKEQLNKNSKNSSRPPSSDGLKKPAIKKNHMHSDCTVCPYRASCLDKACIKETRHEVDTVVTVDVTAHNLMEVRECPLHGGVKTGSFPENIKATVQCVSHSVSDRNNQKHGDRLCGIPERYL